MTELSPTLDGPKIIGRVAERESAALRSSERAATLMLVVVTFIWGLSFSWLKDWQVASGDCPGGGFIGGGLLASFTLIGIRMTVAFVIVAIFLPRLVFGPTLREHVAGAIVGLALLAGHVPQVWGLGSTTPALSALFTSLASAWVPFAAWVYLRERPGAATFPGFALAITGTLVIAGVVPGGSSLEGSGLKFGDWLTLLASVAFTCQILVLDRVGRTVRPGHLTAGFFAAPGLLSLALAVAIAAAGPGAGAWMNWTVGTLVEPKVQWNIVLMTLFPTVLGFYWMNVYQPRVTASRAALIYLLEPVFAAGYSVWQGHDRVTVSLLAGGALILAGNAVIELPKWLARRVTPA
jgi:drug/metabolite transporter (DMT)-like permease